MTTSKDERIIEAKKAEITAARTGELFTISESHPPALEAARRRLAKLQDKADRLLREALEDGSDGELRESQDWQALHVSIANQEREVTRLEAEARKL